MDRRERTMEFMRRFGATDPTVAFERGYYVNPPGEDPIERLLTSIELGTVRRYGLVGGVGSGKSTWMLAMCQRAKRSSQVRSVYVDVNEAFPLGDLSPGVLVTSAGRALGSRASGGAEAVEALRTLVREEASPLVVCFDSLERVDDDAKLRRTLRKDLDTLQHMHVTAVVTMPLRWALQPALRGDFEEQFDDALSIEPVDVDGDGGDGEAFLMEVLARRDPGGMLPEESRRALIRMSGGVLRDLLSLTQEAAQEMYSEGGDRVAVKHVASGARRLGENLGRGLSSHEVDVLLEVNRTGSFDAQTDGDVGLLVSRRVLRRSAGPRRFVVHPALVPRLQPNREAA